MVNTHPAVTAPVEIIPELNLVEVPDAVATTALEPLGVINDSLGVSTSKDRQVDLPCPPVVRAVWKALGLVHDGLQVHQANRLAATLCSTLDGGGQR